LEIKGKKFVIGDIHGSYRALLEVFKKSNFDFQNDLVIFLGDICDGWSEVRECLDFIMTIPNKITIMGNHDEWTWHYFMKMSHYANNSMDTEYLAWKAHGGWATIYSLTKDGVDTQKYIDYISSFKYYHEEDGSLFVHAGYSDMEDDNGNIIHPSKQHPYSLCWDRQLIKEVYRERKNPNYKLNCPWKEVYVGHTPTTDFNDFYTKPQNWFNIWNMDTASAFEGRVSMMDIETKEVFQSEPSYRLYPNEMGRNAKSKNIRRIS
jgi:serine/threonine protein phosphatase 1